LALLNLVVNVRDTPRVGDKLAILTRNIEGTVLGSIGWLKRRNFVLPLPPQIAGLPSGAASGRQAQTGYLEKRSLTRDVGFESVSLQRRV
jgi:hypothetical protein